MSRTSSTPHLDPPPPGRGRVGTGTIPYAELHARSAFSFLEGASHPEELVAEALRLGLSGLALCDQNGLYGAVEARDALLDLAHLGKEAEESSPLKLLYGSELSVETAPSELDAVTALVLDREGYRSLCSLISQGRLAVEKGEFRLARDELGLRTRGLHFLVGGPRSAALRALGQSDIAGAKRSLSELHELLGDRLTVELTRQLAPGDHQRSLAMAEIARQLGLPVVATNDVGFHAPEKKPLHDLLRCIRLGITLEEAGRQVLPNAEAHLKSARQMAMLFHDLPEAIARSLELAAAVQFRLCDVRYAYPAPDLPAGTEAGATPGQDADQVLAELCRQGLRERLGAAAQEYQAQLQKELDLIRELQYAGYFLSMSHIVEVCAEKGILCQGRGSAANSLCCYALRITSVPPTTIEMLFERFLSRERNEPPDIDLDIEHERREETLQHVYQKFGRDHAGMVAEVIRYRGRSALREAGKALGFPETQLNRMSKFLSHHWEELDPAALRSVGMTPGDPTVERLFAVARQLEGLPRHLSIHVGGFVLSREKLSEIVPLENGRMADRTVIQWDKDGVDSMGMFKLDLLGLGMLTVISKAFALVEQTRGVRLGLETVPAEDPAVYAMIQRADTIGVFQIESRAQMNMLPRLKPGKFYDLVIEVAIVRPGPIQGKMVHPYLRRRRGQEAIDYPHPKLKQILHRTLGVPLFQEQVMRLAEAIGGYTPGEADQLRRDMAAWRRSGKMERHRQKLTAGMLANGLSVEFAARIFEQIEGFGSYGFPESHAAAFAHLAYVTAYLKHYFPVEFAAALINSQPMGFYSPAVIVNDLKRHGAKVLRPDVRESLWDCTVSPLPTAKPGEGPGRGVHETASVANPALRLGLRLVRSFSEQAADRIVQARTQRPFSSIADLAERAGLNQRQLISLAAAGALEGFGERRSVIWKAAGATLTSTAKTGDLFAGIPKAEAPVKLSALTEAEGLALDARYAATFPGRHPMELLRAQLDRRGILRACDLRSARPDSIVTVAGLVITRQRPQSANGTVFMTLEDETGNADIAVSSECFRAFQAVARLSSALMIRGRLRADGLTRSVNAQWLGPLRETSAGLPSHDFH